MLQNNQKPLLEIIKSQYPFSPSEKAKKYIPHFYSKIKKGDKIQAKVEGNHGTYTISIQSKNNILKSACSCYIGKHGGCHHVTALAFNYMNSSNSFEEQKVSKRDSIKDLKTLQKYLKDTSLEDLVDELKTSKGITQTAFAQSIGMSSRHLGAVKTAENRNRHFKELGAIKLACLYVLERKKIKG